MTRAAPQPTWTPRLSRIRYEPHPGDEPAPAHAPVGRFGTIGAPAGPGHTPTEALRTQLAELLRAALEVFDGRRSPTQLTAGFTESSLRYWRAAAGASRRSPVSSRLVQVRLDRPQAHVAEVAAVVSIANRYRALPARFERGADRVWRCTAIRLL
ncbi:MAG: Rv3235 family protein [Pseudonocardia sp.]|nr:Rv3235 family protein [Pseudonocardia sp.]